ncbi:MAG: hypothetical protein ACI8R4_001341, partial [Paracoccaceae bacterium]
MLEFKIAKFLGVGINQETECPVKIQMLTIQIDLPDLRFTDEIDLID